MNRIFCIARKELVKRLRSIQRDQLSDDFRKIGTSSFSLGVIALLVVGDKITSPEAGFIIVFGLLTWVLGLTISPKKEGNLDE